MKRLILILVTQFSLTAAASEVVEETSQAEEIETEAADAENSEVEVVPTPDPIPLRETLDSLPLDAQGRLLRQSFENVDISGINVLGEICYHSSFNNVDFTAGYWSFTTVSRFCNFTDSTLDYSEFAGFLQATRFTNSSLIHSRFDLAPNSTVTFLNCDLTGARIYANGANLKFVDTDTSNATIIP